MNAKTTQPINPTPMLIVQSVKDQVSSPAK